MARGAAAVDEAVRDGRSVTLLFGAAIVGRGLPDEPAARRGRVRRRDRGRQPRAIAARCWTSCSTTRPGRTRRSRPGRRRCSTRSPGSPSGRRGRLGVATLGRKRGGGQAGRRPDRRRRGARRGSRCSSSRRSGAPRARASGAWWPARAGPSARAARARRSPPTSSSGRRREGEAARVHGEAGAVIRTRGRRPSGGSSPRSRPAPAEGAGPRSRRRLRRPPTAPAADAAVDALGGRPVSLAVDLGRGLVLENPVIVASGPFGYGVEVARRRRPRAARRHRHPQHDAQAAVGPPGPAHGRRAGRRPARDGPPEPGDRRGARALRAHLGPWPVPVIVSLAGESASDVVDAVARARGRAGHRRDRAQPLVPQRRRAAGRRSGSTRDERRLARARRSVARRTSR